MCSDFKRKWHDCGEKRERNPRKMNTVSAVQTMFGRKVSSGARSNPTYGALSDHAFMEELPHPARNLTVSRVVIMVRLLAVVLFINCSKERRSSHVWKSGVLCMCFELGLFR